MVLDFIGEVVVGVVEAVGEAVGEAATSLFSDAAPISTPTDNTFGATNPIVSSTRSVIGTAARFATDAALNTLYEAIDESKEEELPVVDIVLKSGFYHAVISNGFDFAKPHHPLDPMGAAKYPIIGLQDIPKGKIIKSDDKLFFEFTSKHQFSTIQGERCHKSGNRRFVIIKTKK